MSKNTTTIRLNRAVGFQYDGKPMSLGIGYHVLPNRILDHFRKVDPVVFELGIVEVNAKPGSSESERRIARQKEHRASTRVEPLTLAEVFQPGGHGSKNWQLRQGDGFVLPAAFTSQSEALKAMLEHNEKAWASWEAKQPKAP